MDPEIRQRMVSNPGFRFARWTLPWIGLLLIIVAIVSLAATFRNAAAERDAAAMATGTVDATSTAAATGTAEKPKPKETPAPAAQTPAPAAPGPAPATASSGPTVIAVAMVEGILLRKESSSSGEVIDRLKNGTEMVVLEQGDAWLKIRDPLGRVGWIRNNPNLISLKQTK